MSALSATAPLPWQRDHAVLACEARRAQALVQRDWAALASLLAPGLRYTHATGITHDRDAYLAYVPQGPVFASVQVQQPRVLALGDEAALLTGRLVLRWTRPGEAATAEVAQSVLTQLWQRHGTGWQLAWLQSTREASP